LEWYRSTIQKINNMITVDEFMTADPYTLRETDSLEDARKIMTEKHIRHIPVTDGNNHVLGLVTQRDVLAATDPALMLKSSAQAETGASAVKLADIMIRDVSVISQHDSLRQAALFLQAHKYGCLPVVSSDKLVGIITDSDFIEIAINLLEQVELTEKELQMELEEEETMENVEPTDVEDILER
jgi:CBS domain-containing membrane protein